MIYLLEFLLEFFEEFSVLDIFEFIHLFDYNLAIKAKAFLRFENPKNNE